jgi:RNA polymerase sigma factor (sigma-70 family)
VSGSTSLQEIYDASYRRLVLQVFAFCGDLADAEDAVQEAFVKAIRMGRGFQAVDNPEAWLRTVALNHQRNSWRHAGVVRRFALSVPGQQAISALGSDHVDIMRALAELEADQRMVVVLHYLADMGTAAIARELDVPEGTVKSRLARARGRLVPLLEEREGSGHV